MDFILFYFKLQLLDFVLFVWLRLILLPPDFTYFSATKNVASTTRSKSETS